MLEEKKDILSRNAFLNARENRRLEARYEHSRKLLFALSIFLSLAIICLIYYLLPVSRIYKINVEGNYYLSKDKVVELSGLSYDDRFLLSIPAVIEKKIMSDPLVSSCQVSLRDDRIVYIEIEENKIIGYAYENGKNVAILDNGNRIEIDKNNLYLIGKVPFMQGFSDDEIVTIAKELENVDKKMINEISEMHKYPQLKYQDIELIMRDGNYIFTSVYGLDIINMYYEMVSRLSSGENKCYYFEDISGNAYTSACPWQLVEETGTQDDAQSED